MDIEKIARSEFEKAEQAPPKEVWEEIEAKLHGTMSTRSEKSVGGRSVSRYLWTIGAGITIAVALVAVFTIKGQQTAIDASKDVIVEEHTALDEAVVSRETMEIKRDVDVSLKSSDELTKRTATSESTVMDGSVVSTKKVNAATQEMHKSESQEPIDDADEPIFDLLEYQLASHEYDIPTATQSPKQPHSQTIQKSDGQENSSIGDHVIKRASNQTVDLFIPNILSPNGDGHNDCWRIPDLAKYGRASVQVFTAQRKRVYASDDYKGDFCGDGLPSGDYFYVLTIRDLNYTRRGVLVIKR